MVKFQCHTTVQTDKMLSIMLEYGLSGLDVIKQIQKELLAVELPARNRMALIDKCGEIEFRMVEGADEFLQIEALLAAVALAGMTE